MQQSDLGDLWYFILDILGFPRWFAESFTIILAVLALILLWYYCIKGIWVVKVERKDRRPTTKMDGKDRSLRT